MVSKFRNETHDPKGQENKIYTILKGRDGCRYSGPGMSMSPYVIKYTITNLIGPLLVWRFPSKVCDHLIEAGGGSVVPCQKSCCMPLDGFQLLDV